MDFTYLFPPYDNLVSKADLAFQKIENEHPQCMKCKVRCSDCCHAVFGLFLIEAAFLKRDFDRLDEKVRREALLRSDRADRDLERLEKKLKTFDNDLQMKAYTLARERVRCPLLDDDNECILYPYRPITCRVYGIPTSIQGRARVCNKADFKKDEFYPTFDLDAAFRELYALSKELLKNMGGKDVERASLLISVSRAVRTPIHDIINEIL
ncbi:MAG: YkgJ family cysteine cluster protein [Thermodesulfobacteriota bacterium]|nr:YkgJ family cysteine cluster protein [Thermodesulfobacteriota bacterium]